MLLDLPKVSVPRRYIILLLVPGHKPLAIWPKNVTTIIHVCALTPPPPPEGRGISSQALIVPPLPTLSQISVSTHYNCAPCLFILKTLLSYFLFPKLVLPVLKPPGNRPQVVTHCTACPQTFRDVGSSAQDITTAPQVCNKSRGISLLRRYGCASFPEFVEWQGKGGGSRCQSSTF